MDRSWIDMPRNTNQYMRGLNTFLDFAFTNSGVRGKIVCPCQKCNFKKWQSREEVYEHLIIKPFPKGYTVWHLHGERRVNDEAPQVMAEAPQVMVEEDGGRVEINDNMCEMINDNMGAESSHTRSHDGTNFFELMQDGQQSLYEGCDKYSKLSFLVKLYHIKCLCRISDKAMSMILELLADAFEHAKIPNSFYEAKKVISKLGLHYTKIDACPNDCMLYVGEDKDKDSCKKCKTSRWKPKKRNTIGDDVVVNKRKKIPAKVLRYFPLKPRLQRMFLSSKIAEHMRWHASESTDEGMLRHPRDSEAWKKFDLMHPQFALDPRNVRLGLATDGFNPYGNLSTNHSIWPVVLIPYNLPPWMCMKQSSLEIGEKIQTYESTTSSQSKEISSLDSLAHALGSQEHCGRVRGLGLGPCPSKVFGIHARSHIGSSSSTPSNVELQSQVSSLTSSNVKLESQVSSLTSQVNEMKAIMTLLLQNHQGPLPSQFAVFQRSSVSDQGSGPNNGCNEEKN